MFGESADGGGVGAEEEVEGVLGSVETTGGVQSWTYAESYITRADGRGDPCVFDEGGEAEVIGRFELFESVADDDSIFSDEGDDVGDGSDGGNIEVGFEVKVFQSACFEKGVCDFEYESGSAEIGEFAAGF